MNKIRTILIPFNFSRTAERALSYAVDYVGKDANLKIMLAYISEDQNFNKHREAFNATKDKYQTALKHNIEWVSTSGPLTETLIKIQQTENIDLIIMGTLGTLGAKDDDTTNTSTLVLEANCPVLAVPYSFKNNQIQNIGLVLGKEEIEDTQVLGKLLEVARKFNAKVHVITIENKPGTYGYSKVDEKNENAIQYYLENFYSQHVFIKNPDVVKGILTYATEKNIDMIAILPRNHSTNSQSSEGELTHMLTLHSQIPVLAID